MDEIRILTEGAIVVRILISLAFGAILGLDRGLKSRPAGLRTYKSYRRRLKKELAAYEEKGPFSEGGLYEGKDLKDVLLTFPPR